MTGYQVMEWMGWGLVLVAAAVAVWALLWDRARGRRRCSKCWYDMSGVVGLRCPECGVSARGEKGLVRTRRRWGFVIGAGVIVLVGVGLRRWPHIDSRGWVAAVPDVVLVYAVDPMSPGSELEEEIDGRMGMGFSSGDCLLSILEELPESVHDSGYF